MQLNELKRRISLVAVHLWIRDEVNSFRVDDVSESNNLPLDHGYPIKPHHIEDLVVYLSERERKSNTEEEVLLIFDDK